MERAEKEQWVAEYTERLNTATIAILADFRGVTVEDINAFRTKVRQAEGIDYKVGKNTLFKRAFETQGWSALDPFLKGPTGVLIGDDDIVQVAKIATEFQKENSAFEIKAGIAEGQLLDLDGVKALSKMPSKPELRSQLLGLFTAVPAKFLALLNTPASQFLGVLEARKSSLEEEQGED